MMKEEYEQKCKKILDEHGIRFAGLIDDSGKLIAGGVKQGIDLKLNPTQLESILKEMASRISKRKIHDKELGRVKYSASRREDVVIMSFPIYQNAVAVVTESNVNIDRIAWRIIEILGYQWSEFVGK
ncbi:MAG: hypothetical protein IH841_02165 [Thaumarchaeota archaeon]|nr:hypothetical protein [Nitrososphaerota archaeon]